MPFSGELLSWPFISLYISHLLLCICVYWKQLHFRSCHFFCTSIWIFSFVFFFRLIKNKTFYSNQQAMKCIRLWKSHKTLFLFVATKLHFLYFKSKYRFLWRLQNYIYQWNCNVLFWFDDSSRHHRLRLKTVAHGHEHECTIKIHYKFIALSVVYG